MRGNCLPRHAEPASIGTLKRRRRAWTNSALARRSEILASAAPATGGHRCSIREHQRAVTAASYTSTVWAHRHRALAAINFSADLAQPARAAPWWTPARPLSWPTWGSVKLQFDLQHLMLVRGAPRPPRCRGRAAARAVPLPAPLEGHRVLYPRQHVRRWRTLYVTFQAGTAAGPAHPGHCVLGGLRVWRCPSALPPLPAGRADRRRAHRTRRRHPLVASTPQAAATSVRLPTPTQQQLAAGLPLKLTAAERRRANASLQRYIDQTKKRGEADGAELGESGPRVRPLSPRSIERAAGLRPAVAHLPLWSTWLRSGLQGA